MLNRGIGIASALLMILANGAIIWRDILPNWWAGDPPPNEALLLGPGEKRVVQVGIYDDAGHTVGTSWTTSNRVGVGGGVTVKTTTVLEPIFLPGDIRTPRVRVETALTYRYGETSIDELDFKMFGLGIPVFLQGEAMPSGEFPLTWQIGEYRDNTVLDSRVPAALGDVIRPFDRLPNLYVGRTWQLALLDPLSQILPQLKQTGLNLDPTVVRVTGTEALAQPDTPAIEAFVVEGGGVMAWVAPDGRVLRQEVVLPLLGKLTLLDEPYDDAARRKAVMATWGRRDVAVPDAPGPADEEEPIPE